MTCVSLQSGSSTRSTSLFGALGVAARRRFGRLRARRRGFELRASSAVSPVSRLPASSSDSSITLRFERFADLRLQFEHRQLQQADGLLQLRRHRELLAES